MGESARSNGGALGAAGLVGAAVGFATGAIAGLGGDAFWRDHGEPRPSAALAGLAGGAVLGFVSMWWLARKSDFLEGSSLQWKLLIGAIPGAIAGMPYMALAGLLGSVVFGSWLRASEGLFDTMWEVALGSTLLTAVLAVGWFAWAARAPER